LIPAFDRDGGEESFLVGEMPVRRVPRHAAPCADLPQGDGLRAAFIEQFRGGVEQGAAGLGRRLLAAGHGTLVIRSVDVVI
jgi:hypothetical protein